MAYERYGDEWEKEILKNPKRLIVAMLRNAAKERDSYAAQQSVQADGDYCDCLVKLPPLDLGDGMGACPSCNRPRR